MSKRVLFRSLIGGVISVMGLLWLLSGMSSIGEGIEVLRFGDASLSWPSVTGRIEDSSLVSEEAESGSLTRAVIEYSYTVNGATYRSTRIGFGDFGAGPGTHAEELVSKYPKNAEVSVYYLVSDPKVATLRQGKRYDPWPTIFIGLGFAVLGLIIGYAGWRSLRSG